MSNLEECLMEFRRLIREWRDEIVARQPRCERQLISHSSSPEKLTFNSTTTLENPSEPPKTPSQIHSQKTHLVAPSQIHSQKTKKPHHKFIPKNPITNSFPENPSVESKLCTTICITQEVCTKAAYRGGSSPEGTTT
jgi:hypothetical protein